MKPMDSEQLATVVHFSLRVLNQRLLTLISLLLNAGMFGWAMWGGGYDRLAVAGAFAVATWTLVHLKGEKS